MARKKSNISSGVGGQAVLEGVMMKNKEEYAIAVRKPDGEIEVEIDVFRGAMSGKKIKEVPFIRGVFNFVDSMVLGMKTITYSASFYEDAEAEATAFDKAIDKVFKDNAEKILMGVTTVFSIVLAVAIFMLLPFYLSGLLKNIIRNDSLVIILEGVIRISIFLIYITAISLMKDIHRLYQYHGAEHKCINCIEKGRPLTVRDVMRSSRLHRRCGTSFMFFVLFVSIVLFFFIRVDGVVLKVLLRLALIPVIAGISYEIIRLAGRSNNIIVRILSAPGMLIQRLTTKEPDKSMVEVAMKAVEAVFDWKAYQKEVFGYDVDDSWLDEDEAADGGDADEEEYGQEPMSFAAEENAEFESGYEEKSEEDNVAEDNEVEGNAAKAHEAEDNEVEDNGAEDNEIEDNEIEDNEIEDNAAEDNETKDNEAEYNEEESAEDLAAEPDESDELEKFEEPEAAAAEGSEPEGTKRKISKRDKRP